MVQKTILFLCLVGTILFSFLSGLVNDAWDFWIPIVTFLLIYFVLFWLFFGLMGLVSLPIKLEKKYDRPNKVYYFLFLLIYDFFCSLGRVKIHASGLEKVKDLDNFMLVSNHTSKFDNMIQALILRKKKIAYVSKKENFKVLIGRRYMHRSCYLSLDRENPRDAVKMIRDSSNYISTKACSVGIFPEGTRGSSHTLQDFKAGTFKIATNTLCPIVVVSMRNTFSIHKNAPLKKTHVYMEIVKIINKEEYQDLSTSEIAKLCQNAIQENINERVN